MLEWRHSVGGSSVAAEVLSRLATRANKMFVTHYSG